MRRQVHSIIGEWIGHFLVAAWLRVVAGLLQRCTAMDNVGWEEMVSAATWQLLLEAEAWLKTQGDPVKGRWPVSNNAPISVWVDASSTAVGIVLEVDDDVVEDTSWLRPKQDSAHINQAKLDAAIHGINLALRWGHRKMTLLTDSATVFGWLRAIIDKTHNVKTCALSEVLIRWRLDTMQEVGTRAAGHHGEVGPISRESGGQADTCAWKLVVATRDAQPDCGASTDSLAPRCLAHP